MNETFFLKLKLKFVLNLLVKKFKVYWHLQIFCFSKLVKKCFPNCNKNRIFFHNVKKLRYHKTYMKTVKIITTHTYNTGYVTGVTLS